MSKIGYIRVSTEKQETARQQEIMNNYQVDRIFSEKLSGTNTDRPQLKAISIRTRQGQAALGGGCIMPPVQNLKTALFQA